MGAARLQAEITSVERMARSTFMLELSAPGMAERARPGQFVMLGPLTLDSRDPFLNRPFSIHRRTAADRLQLLVGVVGRGTEMLGSMLAGGRIGVLGPLGNGFELPPGSERLVAIGGGLGVAPLFFLLEEHARAGGQAVLLYGAGSADQLIAVDRLREIGVRVKLATDDGTAGLRGTTADLLERELHAGQAALAACGPPAMLVALADIARAARLELQVSLESRMACGVGACLGCTVFLDSGEPQRVCREGPVFDFREVFGK